MSVAGVLCVVREDRFSLGKSACVEPSGPT